MRELTQELAIDMANRGMGVFDTDDPTLRTIFVGDFPEGVKEGLFLVAVPSPPPEHYIDTQYPVIDVWARSPHSDRALALLRMVYDTYNRRYDWTTTNWHVYFSAVLGDIVDADRDSEGGKFFRLSIQFTCRNLNNIS
jgi:hypothetical protein